jgi:hypothetical protein
MKRLMAIGLALLVTALLMTGISCAGEQKPQETEVLLKGALNQQNQFVDENGRAYDLVINETTAALLNMPRLPIEIKGTLLEHNGKEHLSITEISPVTP